MEFGWFVPIVDGHALIYRKVARIKEHSLCRCWGFRSRIRRLRSRAAPSERQSNASLEHCMNRRSSFAFVCQTVLCRVPYVGSVLTSMPLEEDFVVFFLRYIVLRMVLG